MAPVRGGGARRAAGGRARRRGPGAGLAGVGGAVAVLPPPPPSSPAPPPLAPTPAASEPPLPDDPAVAREAIRLACERRLAACDPVALLGSLERAALDRALAKRGLTVEPQPWGKVVGKIHVVNLPVFGPGDGFLRAFNVFHVTSREYVVEREVILRPGQVWDQDAVEETSRRLRDPVTTTLAVVVPVVTATPGVVDLLVVTRDIWSLRLNSNYRFEGGTFSYLSLSLSENNFLGSHKLAAAVFEMDLGTVGVGPLFIDKNVAGRHLDLRVRAAALFGRDELFGGDGLVAEGSSSTVSLSRPLWKLDSRWGAGVSWTHRYAIAREFQGTSLRTYDAPETAVDDALPWKYEQRDFTLATSVVRGWGGRWKKRVTVGHNLENQRPTVTDDFTGDATLRAAFVRDVLPRSEFNSVVFASYQLFEARYREYRNVGSFDLAEDLQLGLSTKVTLGAGLEAIGSDANFLRGSASAGYTLPWRLDGTLGLSTSASVRRQGGELIDGSTSVTARLVSPRLPGFRVVAEARLSALWNETQNRFLAIGSEAGLRGFAISEFTGQRKVSGQLEVRSDPVPVLFTRCGLVGFYDVGGATDRLPSLALHHDVGLGFRILIPQLAQELMRLDLAVPLDGRAAGRPRLVAGFQSEF
ncbi:MAG: hypothetical protein R2939_13785 [Kofleriaceae bacterium]